MAGKGLSATTVAAAAADLADRKGFDGMSLASLADELGVRVPSLYKHIAGLADLRKRVAILAAAELGGRVADALRQHNGRDGFVAIARTYRSYALAHPGRYQAFCRMPQATAELPETARPLARVAEVLRESGVSESDAHSIILAARCALRGLAELECSGSAGSPDQVDAAFEYLISMFDRALSASTVSPQLARQLSALPMHEG